MVRLLRTSVLAPLEPKWTPEKAWWLGATFGDGYSDNSKGRRRMIFVSGDKDLVENWARIVSSEASINKRSDNCFFVEIGDMRLTEFLAAYGMNGRKEASLTWPNDLPSDFTFHFLRGLWDTDGCVMRTKRGEGRVDQLRMIFANKSEQLIDGMIQAVPCLVKEFQYVRAGRYAGYKYAIACVRGAKAVYFAKDLYFNSPEHLRCQRKYAVAKDYIDWWESNTKLCSMGCGRTVVGRETCKFCARIKIPKGSKCACGNTPLVAKGLCRRCYQRQWMPGKEGKKEFIPASDFLGPKLALEWKEVSETRKAEVLDSISELFSNKAFPWELLNDFSEADVLDAVAGGVIDSKNLELSSISQVGQKTCLTFLPHRFLAHHKGELSIVEAFSDKVAIKRAIALRMHSKDVITPLSVIKSLGALGKMPTNFPPVLARWIVDQYVPENGTVLDPCAGYGGRLLGALASSKNVKYIGHDVEPKTVEGNIRLADHVKQSHRVEIKKQAVEEDTPWPQVDFVFTSPPYYDTEYYGGESDKLIKAYSDVQAWLSNFLTLLIDKALAAAPQFLLNVGAIKNCDLPEEAVRIATSKGYKTEKMWIWKTATFGGNRSKERLILFSR